MEKNKKNLEGVIDSIFGKFSPKNIYYFSICPFYSFPIGKKESKLQTIVGTHRQFVEKLLKFKNIATRELILDCGMRKLGVSIYFLIKKEKSKTENKLNGFGKDHF